ncbi:MAG TPA: aminotransferase class V-fold PLP-dependent enzyme [Thermoanaerobaculia bacterium]|nr:aminotransferase class V-fold PLP-dependent enzyme [Thermoanaerobaculia bacterium]
MKLTRRAFLVTTGVGTAGATLGGCRGEAVATATPAAAANLQEWAEVRGEFDLAPEWIHLGLFFFVSHPRPVREAIDRYRRELDANPVMTIEHAMFVPDFGAMPNRVKGAIARYIGGRPDEIALVGSTTEGLAAVYQGLPLRAGDEVLTTDHDHYVHHESIRLAAERAGASWRTIPLFDSPDAISEEEIVSRIRRAIRPSTRAVGITWVHSSTGLRLPIAEIGAAVAEVNVRRPAARRVLLVVDGVHGLGAADPAVAASGCDFFCSGAHKWLFGPRGTGFVWGRSDAWALMRPGVPSFESGELFVAWMEGKKPAGPPKANWFSPGGFHAYEHVWAIPDAIRFHEAIGPARVTARIAELNGQMKEGLAGMDHVTLYTPRASSLSAGIVCFDVAGMSPPEVVERLLEKRIIATTTPYPVSYARISCGIMNTEAEVETALRAIRDLA